MTMLVNKFFHEMNGSIDTSLEPLNEIYFDQDSNMIELENTLNEFLKLAKESMENIKLKKQERDLEVAAYDKQHNNNNLQASPGLMVHAIKLINRRPSRPLPIDLNDEFSEIVKSSPYIKKAKSLIKKIFGFADVFIEEGSCYTSLAANSSGNRLNTSMYNRRIIDSISPDELNSPWGFGSPLITKARKSKRIKNVFLHRYDKIKDLDDTRFIDDYGNDRGSIKNLGERILELKKDKNGKLIGIRFDRKSVKIDFKLLINWRLTELVQTGKELLGIILHEIGHTFSTFIMQRKVDISGSDFSQRLMVTDVARADEMFADQFAAMYGYGIDMIEVLYRAYIVFKDDPKFALALKKTVSSVREPIPKDPHPLLINRLKRVLSQLYIDLKDPNLSTEAERKLRIEIDRGQRLLTVLKSNQGKNSNAILARAEKETKFDKGARKIASPAKFNNFKFLDPNAR